MIISDERENMYDKKRVIHFNNSLSGGAGKSILTLAQAMAEEGIETSIIIYEDKIDYEIPANVRVTILDKDIHRFNKRAIVKMLKEEYINRGGADMIISNSSPSNKILSMANIDNSWHCVRSAETKNFYGIVGKMKQKFRYAKYKRLYDNKRLITVSVGLKDYITQELGAKPERVETIYNAFDFETIRALSNENDDDIPDEDYIIHIGRYDIAHKRQDILIKAYKKSALPHKLILLGQGRDRDKIADIIKDYALEDRVILAGFKSNPYPWIKRASMLAFSSDFEGFARVLLEALALNRPVVSTNCPTGPSEILTGELSQFLVSVGDTDALAEKMKQAMHSYPKIDKSMFHKFTKKEIVRQYKMLLGDL